MHPQSWSTEDFSAMSWHDCHVHGLRVFEGEDGYGQLQLDLDYILEWQPKQEGFSFLLVPATLRFNQVFGLSVTLDWAAPTAAMGAFSLSGIERRSEIREHYTATLWHLPVNWPSGAIKFEAEGFTQVAWGREVLSPGQVLGSGERVAA